MRFSLVFIFIFSNYLFGQNNVAFTKQDIPNNKKELLNAKRAITRGDLHFDNGNFNKALDNYLIAQNINDQNDQLNLKFGMCYFNSNRDSIALQYFNKAFSLNNKVIPNINYYLAVTHQLLEDFNLAQDLYSLEKDRVITSKDSVYRIELDKYLIECKSGIELKANQDLRYKLKNLGDSINGVFNEYSVHFNPIDSVMFFTAIKETSSEDIYISKKQDNSWVKSGNVGDPLNSFENDGVVGFSNDGKKIFLFSDYNNGDILYSERKEAKWSEPIAFSNNINSRFTESSLAFSDDDSTLYLVSNRKESTIGGKDIFFSKKIGNDWQIPINIGPDINTKYDEEGVFVTGDTLFFSSRGHNSVGGYDVFKSYKLNDSVWSKPINLGFPINSSYDDVFYHEFVNEKFLSSDRPGGKGMLDIYCIQLDSVYLERKLLSDMKKLKDSLKIENKNREALNDFDNADYNYAQYEIENKRHDLIKGVNVKDVIELNPVYFALNDFSISAATAKELDKIILILNQHNDINLEVESHTDCQGSSSYNKILSEKRAASIINYFNAKIDDQNRVSGVGRGEDNLIVDCQCEGVIYTEPCTDEQHKENRRTEFKIIKRNNLLK